MQSSDRQNGLVHFWCAFVAVVVCASEVLAAGMGGGSIPQVSSLMGMVTGTITGPVALAFFATGCVKAGVNVWKAGGIHGLAEGGAGAAAAGLLLGGTPWLAGMMGVTGALLR